MEKIKRLNPNFKYPSAIIVAKDEWPEYCDPHWHNAVEFIVALDSGCRFRINDVLYDPEKGDIILIWPYQVHEAVMVPKGSALFVLFPSAIIENNLDIVAVSRLLYDCHHIMTKNSPNLAALISEKIDDIQTIHYSSITFSETRCKQCIYDILLALGEHVLSAYGGRKIPSEDLGSGWNYVHTACAYIVENSEDPITEALVAEHTGLSPCYFSKLFKEYMHMSFPAYLSKIRVKNATTLLLDDSLTITECAYKAGFQSTTTFNKAFLNITGYSPREFRRLHKC